MNLQKVRVDYSITYFSGHGFTSDNSEQMLVVQDQVVNVQSLVNHSPRQLIIVDACRDYMGAQISGSEVPGGNFNFDGESFARDLFDQYIFHSPPGITIVYATQRGMFAEDHPVTGGYFTRALLDAALGLRVEQGYHAASIEQLVHRVPEILSLRSNQQVPEMQRVWGNLSVPFALCFPVHEQVPIKVETERPQVNYEWGTAAALLLLVAVAVASK